MVKLTDEQLVEIIKEAQIMAGEEPDVTLDNLESEEKIVAQNFLTALLNNLNQEQVAEAANLLGGRFVSKENDINSILYRETDDCTAYPVFLAFRKHFEVSQSSVESIDVTELAKNIENNQGSYIDIGFNSFDMKEELINRDIPVDDIDSYQLTEVLKEITIEAGKKCDDLEGEIFYFWSEEDEIESDQVERCFWTRKEANTWCKSQSHNGEYYSYSIMADGVLQDVLKLTCKREIDRVKNLSIK